MGALNSIGEGVHRRDALWQVERAGRQPGPLLASLDCDEEVVSPLRAMAPEERMVADYASTGVTVGRHPMAHCRLQLRSMQVVRAGDLPQLRHGVQARIAGCVIARQRPGTAHGFIFLSIEDETGISNAIIDPELYERHRSLVTYARFLLIEGALQNVDKVIHIRAKHIEELNVTAAPTQSHDWHQMSKPMSEPMTSPGEREPPKDWWLENACRIAAFRLRQARYLGANTIPIREQVRDSVEFVRLVWEEIERSLKGKEP